MAGWGWRRATSAPTTNDGGARPAPTSPHRRLHGEDARGPVGKDPLRGGLAGGGGRPLGRGLPGGHRQPSAPGSRCERSMAAFWRAAFAGAQAGPTASSTPAGTPWSTAVEGDTNFEPGYIIRNGYVAYLRGYAGHQSRTVVIGTPSEEQRRIYRAVRDVYRATIDRCRPGVRVSDVHRFAAEAFREAGFSGRLALAGHSVGAWWHQQPPFLVPSDDTVLEAGMVLALEPHVDYWHLQNMALRYGLRPPPPLRPPQRRRDAGGRLKPLASPGGEARARAALPMAG